jgi:hypothetical protein
VVDGVFWYISPLIIAFLIMYSLLIQPDKNVVGTGNALTGGWGNAGGGITYFVMPAIFDSLVQKQHLSVHVAWRVSFIVPFIIITVTAIAMLLLCPDTPTGKWSERHLAVQRNLQTNGVHVSAGVVDIPGAITDKRTGVSTPTSGDEKRRDEQAEISKTKQGSFNHEATMGQQEMLDAAKGEVVVKPTFKEVCTLGEKSLSILERPTSQHASAWICKYSIIQSSSLLKHHISTPCHRSQKRQY